MIVYHFLQCDGDRVVRRVISYGVRGLALKDVPKLFTLLLSFRSVFSYTANISARPDLVQTSEV